MHVRCIGYAMIGGLAGCGVAWAQDPGMVSALTDPSLGSVTDLGWPGALAFLGWLIGRGNFQLPAIRIVVEHPSAKVP